MRADRTHPVRLPFLLALLPLLACGEDFKPATYVDRLRVLAIAAEPPDLHPGELTTLTALVADPRDPARRNGLIWLACDPDKSDLAKNLCANFNTLSDPGALVDSGGALPSTLRVLGFDQPVRYQAPVDLFDALAPDDPMRRRGALSFALLIAVGEALPNPFTEQSTRALFQRLRDHQVDSVLAIKRLRVSEDPQRNHNPTVDALSFGGALYKGSGTRPARVWPRRSVEMEATSPDSAVESYAQIDGDGLQRQVTEKLQFAWFSTFGRFGAEHTLAGAATQHFMGPWGDDHDPIPDERRGTMWVVIRDGRGGVAWINRDLFACDADAPPPVLSSISPDTGTAGTVVTLRGENLDRVLDVKAGDDYLTGSFDTASGAFVGAMPAQPLGPAMLVLRGRSCRDAVAADAFTYR